MSEYWPPPANAPSTDFAAELTLRLVRFFPGRSVLLMTIIVAFQLGQSQ
jgi:hypothetical protein